VYVGEAPVLVEEPLLVVVVEDAVVEVEELLVGRMFCAAVCALMRVAESKTVLFADHNPLMVI
jgi:hypothetical protein